MSRAKVPADHAERCLGHVIGGVRGIYDRHSFRGEMADAYSKLAELIAAILQVRQLFWGVVVFHFGHRLDGLDELVSGDLPRRANEPGKSFKPFAHLFLSFDVLP